MANASFLFWFDACIVLSLSCLLVKCLNCVNSNPSFLMLFILGDYIFSWFKNNSYACIECFCKPKQCEKVPSGIFGLFQS